MQDVYNFHHNYGNAAASNSIRFTCSMYVLSKVWPFCMLFTIVLRSSNYVERGKSELQKSGKPQKYVICTYNRNQAVQHGHLAISFLLHPSFIQSAKVFYHFLFVRQAKQQLCIVKQIVSQPSFRQKLLAYKYVECRRCVKHISLFIAFTKTTVQYLVFINVIAAFRLSSLS